MIFAFKYHKGLVTRNNETFSDQEWEIIEHVTRKQIHCDHKILEIEHDTQESENTQQLKFGVKKEKSSHKTNNVLSFLSLSLS